MNDSRKERWVEQFEDAALGILMEDYADAEGARLLQEFEAAAQQGSIPPVPEDVDAACLKLIDQAYKKPRRKKILSAILNAAGKTAAVVLMLLGLASAVRLSVDAFRALDWNFLREQTCSYTVLRFNNVNMQFRLDHSEIEQKIYSIIPEGYQLTYISDSSDLHLYMRFQNDAGSLLTIDVGPASGTYLVDTEDSVSTQMELQGHCAYFIQKQYLHILWYDEVRQTIYTVFSDGLSTEEFLDLVNALAE